jgi:hypothetical protein
MIVLTAVIVSMVTVNDVLTVVVNDVLTAVIVSMVTVNVVLTVVVNDCINGGNCSNGYS